MEGFPLSCWFSGVDHPSATAKPPSRKPRRPWWNAPFASVIPGAEKPWFFGGERDRELFLSNMKLWYWTWQMYITILDQTYVIYISYILYLRKIFWKVYMMRFSPARWVVKGGFRHGFVNAVKFFQGFLLVQYTCVLKTMRWWRNTDRCYGMVHLEMYLSSM